jgi:putative ABC transport system substrate-binding protein
VVALPYFCFPRLAASGGANVAVLYPDVREPYQRVFHEIVRGIEAGTVGPVDKYLLNKDREASASEPWSAKNGARVVIALGNRGLSAVQDLPPSQPIIVGALLERPPGNPSGLSGIVLTPDPAMLLGELKKLSSAVKRVTVVYKAATNQWLIDRAKGVAARLGLSLRALPARGLREAAQLYRDVLQEGLGGLDAIWLLQDDTVLDERTILPLILKDAWRKGFVVFSGNPIHVKRGALFALYPDNFRMGKSLARLAQASLKGEHQNERFRALEDVRIAVNIRTAEHLGLSLGGRLQREFDLVFPSQ